MDAGFPWWIMIAVVVVGIIVYVLFMIFLPEWVGIAGKTAKLHEESHRAQREDESGDQTNQVSDLAEPPEKPRL